MICRWRINLGYQKMMALQMKVLEIDNILHDALEDIAY